MKVYYDRDADAAKLKDKTISIIGYGAQGYAHANNLRDSGFDVIVGLRRDSPSRAKAEAAGLKVQDTAEAAFNGDVVMMLVPDELAPSIYRQEIEPNLLAGNYLAFAHGFSIHYRKIAPLPEVNVFMVAPKGPGHLLRHEYTNGRGVPCLLAVHRDSTGNTREVGLAYAGGIGGGRAGVIETTFREETETDLFGEQAVLCGGLGIANMRYSVSNTAEYGDLTRGPRVIDESVREEMRRVLKDVQSGAFADEWIAEHEAGKSRFRELEQTALGHPIEDVGRRLRAMMPWLGNGRLVDRAKN